MELTRESPRARWLILSVTAGMVAVIVVLHTLAMRDYVGLLDGLGRRGATGLVTQLQRPIPTPFAISRTTAARAPRPQGPVSRLH